MAVPEAWAQPQTRFALHADLTTNVGPNAVPLFSDPVHFNPSAPPADDAYSGDYNGNPDGNSFSGANGGWYGDNNNNNNNNGNAGALPPHLQAAEESQVIEDEQKARAREAAQQEWEAERLRVWQEQQSAWEEQQRQQQQHHAAMQEAAATEQPISIVAFDVSPEEADEMFRKWVQSLWFAPTGFKKHVESTDFKKVYIPHYIISATAHTNWKAEVGFDHRVPVGDDQHHKKSTSRQGSKHSATASAEQEYRTETCWERASGADVHVYDEEQVCADVDPVLHRVVSRCGAVKLGSHVTSSRPSILTATDHYINKWQTWTYTWEKVFEPLIETRERAHAERQAKSERNADHVRHLHCRTYFTNVQYSMAFFPYYVAEYFESASADSARMFVVNGQNKTYNGQRPSMGLGKLGDYKKGVGNLFHTLFGTTEEVRMIPGDELSTLDNVRCYDPDSFYLTLPRSNSYVFGESTGFIVLQSNSDTPIEVEAQKRRGTERGKTAVLERGKVFASDFKGHWVLRIAKGQPSELEIIEVAVKGGGKGNKLGMS